MLPQPTWIRCWNFAPTAATCRTPPACALRVACHRDCCTHVLRFLPRLRAARTFCHYAPRACHCAVHAPPPTYHTAYAISAYEFLLDTYCALPARCSPGLHATFAGTHLYSRSPRTYAAAAAPGAAPPRAARSRTPPALPGFRCFRACLVTPLLDTRSRTRCTRSACLLPLGLPLLRSPHRTHACLAPRFCYRTYTFSTTPPSAATFHLPALHLAAACLYRRHLLLLLPGSTTCWTTVPGPACILPHAPRVSTSGYLLPATRGFTPLPHCLVFLCHLPCLISLCCYLP